MSMLWGNTATPSIVKLSGEDMSHYWIERAGLRKCLYYHYLTKKVTSH